MCSNGLSSGAADVLDITPTALALSRALERACRKQKVSLCLLSCSNLHPEGHRPRDPLSHKVSSRLKKNSFRPQSLNQRYPSLRKLSLTRGGPSKRLQIWLIFQDPSSSRLASIVSITLITAVISATLVFILQTEPAMAPYAQTLTTIEAICVAAFTIDFVVRFCFDFLNVVDFASIVPFYLELILSKRSISSIGALRTLRLLRVTRVFRLSRYTSTLQMFGHAIQHSFQALFILLVLTTFAMIVFSSALYTAESTESGCIPPEYSYQCNPQQIPPPPDPCCEPSPIAATFWWAIVTMMTVGYGDEVPVTPCGYAIASFALMSGILILALPTSVIGSNFQRLTRAEQNEAKQLLWHVKQSRNFKVQEQEIHNILVAHGWTSREKKLLDMSELIRIYDPQSEQALSNLAMEKFECDLQMLHELRPIQNRPLTIQQCAINAQLARFHDTLDQMVQYRLLESEARLEAKIHAIKNKI
ncbi:Voltage-gated Ion Channel (VIC) Superfamily, partial [Thraustotheca clavata]